MEPHMDLETMSAIKEETSKDMRGWSSQDHGSRGYMSSKVNSFGGAAGERELASMKEGEMEEPEEKLPPPPQTSFAQLFTYADSFDYLMIFFGTIGAIAHGLVFPATFWVLGTVIDKFGTYQDKDSHELLRSVTKISIIYFSYALATVFTCWAEVACWMYSGERQCAKIRRLYLQAVLRQEIAFFDVEIGTADFVHQISTNTHQLQEAISEKVGNYLNNMSTFTGGIIVGFYSCWQTALLTFATMPFIAVAGALMTGAQTKYAAMEEDAYLDAGSVAEQVISQIRTVYAYVGELRAKEAYKEALQRTYELGHKAAMAKGVGLGIVLGVVNASWALQLWFGGYLVEHHESRGGKIIISIFCLMFAGIALGQVAPTQQTFNQGKIAAYKIFEVINRKPLIGDPSKKKGKVLAMLEGDIKFKNVEFAYPSRPDHLIFKNFSLEIPKGKTVALVGKSGTGKSTIISLIERFYDPTSGSVKIDGENIKHMKLQWLRQQIGLVAQEPVLFSMSIRETITYGNEDATESEIIAACEAANAYEFITKLPEGFDTQVGENGAQLSGGQKQRLAIARVILKNPKILLLDEATSALDATSEKLVQSALDNLLQGRTTVVVAHRLSTIQNADIIAVLEDGTIAEKGSHSRLLQKNPDGPYARLIRAQTRAQEVAAASSYNSPLASPPMTPTRLAANGKEQRAQRRRNALNVPSASPMHMIALAGSPLSPFTPRRSEIWSMNTDVSMSQDFSYMPDESRDDMSFMTEVSFAGGKIASAVKGENKAGSRLWAMSLKEWPSLTVGAVSAALTGAYNPFFAFFAIQAAAKFYLADLHEMKHQVDKASFLLFLLGIFAFVSNTIQHLSFGHAGEKITRLVRFSMFEKMLQNEVGWFDLDENNTAALSVRLSNDAASVKAVISDRVSVIVQDVSSVVVAMVVGFILEWRVAAVMLATFPFLIIGGWGQQAFLAGFTGDLKKAHVRANATAKEAVSNIRTVASFCAEEKVVNRYCKHLEEPLKDSYKEGLVSGFLLGMSQFLLHGSGAFNLWWCAYLTSKHEANLGTSIKAFQVLTYTAYALAEAIRLAPDVIKGGQAVAEVFRIIDRQTLIDADSKSGKILSALKGRIEFVKVEFRYPSRPNYLVLRNFSLTIPSHVKKKVALVGASGAGKSSIISLLLRFYDIQSGKILIDGTDITTLNLKWLRSQIGLVQQEPALFHTSVAENILYGKEDASESEMIDAARSANAHSFICGLPQGYATNVGERGKQLSGGQKQRVAIARAVLKNPSILLLDEATSALDTESEKVVQQALDRLMNKAKLTVIVAHRLSTIQEADLIFVLENGTVVEEGTHASLSMRRGPYAKLVQQQQLQQQLSEEYPR